MITQGQGFIKVGDSLTEDRIVEANPWLVYPITWIW
jgi:hypothetical protein